MTSSNLKKILLVPGEEIETKGYPWDFSPILNVIVMPGNLGVT